MADYFKKNTKIPLTNKDTAIIKERLGEGGSGRCLPRNGERQGLRAQMVS